MSKARTVRTPEGDEWHLERRLLRPRVNRPRWPGRLELDAETFSLVDAVPFDGDVIGWFVLVAAAIAAVVIVIPVLLFGIEMLIFGIVVAAVLLGSALFARRWVIRAANARTGAVYEREIAGRRAAAAALNRLADEIRAGNEPDSHPGRG